FVPFGVTGEEDRPRAVAYADHEGVVVRSLVERRTGTRREDFDGRAADGMSAAQRGRPYDRSAARTHGREEVGISPSGSLDLPLARIPERANGDRVEPVEEPAEVIRMRVREDDDGDLPAAARTEHRSEHPVPHIERGFDETATIHE